MVEVTCVRYLLKATSSYPHCGSYKDIFALAKNAPLERFINARLRILSLI